MANSKFEFTGETKVLADVTLHRIRALRDFGSVKTGDLGGCLEHEANLSPDGNAWVSGHAQVAGNARVSDNAVVSGYAQVYGNAVVAGDARVYRNAKVYRNAVVFGNALVLGDARVLGKSQVYENAVVNGNAVVSGNACVSGKAWVSGNAQVSRDARVFGNADVSGDAVVDSINAIFHASLVGRDNGTLTVFKSKNGGLLATRGCFLGTVDAFLAKSKAEHDEMTHLEYQMLIQVARMRILRSLAKTA